MTQKKALEKELKAVITGASSGIGKALAILLAQKYQACIVIGGRNLEQLEDTKKQIEQMGGKCLIKSCDIGTPGMARETVQACLDYFGSISLLVNNAGLAQSGRFEDLDTDKFRRVFDVNFFAALEATYAALPSFKKQGFGKIVNVSSVAGKVSFAGSVCYSASKFALTAMSNGSGLELASQNIDVLTVCPGWVRTEFFEKNHVAKFKNPTLIAEERSPRGWIMKHLLSISSKEAALEILSELKKSGSREIVMTAPGKIIERLQGVCPKVVSALNSAIPLDYNK
ncbi:MAG: SDR family oxidoreductase [Candidatus Melainabacteria bacterium]|nr:SDR family oxidoreductase [Candidatus Melainabacteria bacterium]